MKIDIICVGKLKEDYLKKGVSEYSKRLSSYCRLQILQLQDESTFENASDKVTQQILEKEGERILKQISDDAYVIALAIDGKRFSSEGFSKELESLGINGISHVQFIIGGSLGLDKRVLQRADLKLSFSDMTFPHQLMRLILLEQIYRAYRIMKGEPYHK